MTEDNIKSIRDLQCDLGVLADKLRAVGELVGMGCGEPPMSDAGLKGLGRLLIEISEDILKNIES